MTRYGNHLAFGATVVASLLFFTAFVALFRRDLGDPYVAAAIFAGVGLVIAAAGYLAARAANRGGAS
jgi:hypothetical protein